MIYVVLQGRIGNQLFIYSMAKNISEKTGDREIVIDDSEVLKLGWVDSLPAYNLPNTRFVHDSHLLRTKLFPQYCKLKMFHFLMRRKNEWDRYREEEKRQDEFNKKGIIEIRNGYMPYQIYDNENYLIDGFFQSERFFQDINGEIKKELTIPDDALRNYPGIEKIRNRNSVCISIKVEHNVGSSLYDVCTQKYWENAIQYITKHVENPLFFICSDNVQYVKDNLIDCSKYDTISQSRDFPVEVSMAAMSKCKHFIIGNTTFGWWAQYLSDNKEKIVIAPSKWMKIDMPIDIYQDNWTLIEI